MSSTPIPRDPSLLVDGPMAGQAKTFPYRFVIPVGGKITGMRAWCHTGPISALQVLAEDSTGAPANSRVWGAYSPKPPGDAEIVLESDDLLLGITGKAKQAELESVVLHSMNEVPSDPEKLLGSGGGQTAFSIMPSELPLGAEIVGFYWSFDAAGVSGLGPICQVPGPPDASMLDPDVKWINSTESDYPDHDLSVVPDDTGVGTALPPVATFIAPKIFRVELDGTLLHVYDETAKANVLTFKQMLPSALSGDHQYLYLDESGGEVTVKFPGATHGDIEWISGRRLWSAEPYDIVADNEPTFGHVFAEGTESAFDQSPFHGWNVTLIDPSHLQFTDHIRHKVFDYPKDSTHSYHKSEYGKQKIVPNGVMYVSQVQSTGDELTTSASSEHEIQAAWKYSIGAKAGFGPFAFEASASFRGTLKETLSTACSSTVSKFTLRSHMLFIDLPRVSLDQNFVDDVTQLIHGSSVQYRNFVVRYGTHFAYAITYGARSYMQMKFSKTATIQALSAGTTLEANAAGLFNGLNLGVKASSSIDFSTQAGVEMSLQLKEYQSEGGEAGNHGHLSLGAYPQPMMVDLRPITDLLNPVFFTDPRIYQDVRYKIDQAMHEFCTDAGPGFDVTSHLPPILRLYFVSIQLTPGYKPDPARTAITLEFGSDSDDVEGKFLGFDSFDGFGYHSTVWKATDPKAPKLKAGKEIFLGIEKLFFITEPVPAFGFLVSADLAFGTAPDLTLVAADFSRDVKTKVFPIGAFSVTCQYQLLGGDIEWESETN